MKALDERELEGIRIAERLYQGKKYRKPYDNNCACFATASRTQSRRSRPSRGFSTTKTAIAAARSRTYLVGLPVVRIAGIEPPPPTAQRADQFQSIHSGHVVVNDQTPNRRQARPIEQVVAIGKGAHRETLTLHHVSEGIPHGLIIINDEDDLLSNIRRRQSYHQIAFAVGWKQDYQRLKPRKLSGRFDL
jgi:hypothetical protein